MFDNYKNQTFKEMIAEYAESELEKLMGQRVDDVVNEIMNEANCNGTMTYSTQKSLDIISYFRVECGEVLDKLYNEIGYQEELNPLLRPEICLTNIFYETITTSLADIKTDNIIITDDYINKVKNCINKGE